MFKINKIIKNFAFITAVIVFSFALTYAASAVWTESSAVPPDGNADMPLNSGNVMQIKDAGLILNYGGYNGSLIAMGGKTNPSGGVCPIMYDWYDYNGNTVVDNGECQITSLYVTGLGMVGIGTTTPENQLAIHGNEVNPTRLLLKSDAGAQGPFIRLIHGGEAGGKEWQIGSSGTNNRSGVPGNLEFWYNNGLPGGEDQMIITPAGKVGIGTVNPEFKLSLDNDGGILAKGTLGSGATLTATGYYPRLIWYPKKAAFRAGLPSTEWDDANIGLYSFASGVLTTASGDGSTALGHQTTASGPDSTAIGISSNATGQSDVAIGVANTASGGGGALAMGVGTTSSGVQSIAIGIASEASGRSAAAFGGEFSKATAMGAMAFGQAINANADYSMVIGRGLTNVNYLTNTIPSSLMIGFYSDIPTVFVGSSSGAGTTGNVGIATMTPGEKLDVVGNVQATGFLYSSDERLKENTLRIGNPLDKILKLNGISFNWKDNGEKGIGFTAQNVETVFPELVKTNSSTGMKSVEYGNLVAPLVEAIKEQQKMIEKQQKEIDDLKILLNNSK